MAPHRHELAPNSELEDASNLLGKANIVVTMTGHPQDIPNSCQQTAAWFIREATTNVMKHSSASNAKVTFSEHAVSITNDGVARNFGPLSAQNRFETYFLTLPVCSKA